MSDCYNCKKCVIRVDDLRKGQPRYYCSKLQKMISFGMLKMDCAYFTPKGEKKEEEKIIDVSKMTEEEIDEIVREVEAK